jgi:16S rRNA C967 or C1407 C5-methylase (RsmB/RsmF family)
VYATCALEKEENVGVVKGFAVIETHTRVPGQNPGDGFFAAVIK